VEAEKSASRIAPGLCRKRWQVERGMSLRTVLNLVTKSNYSPAFGQGIAHSCQKPILMRSTAASVGRTAVGTAAEKVDLADRIGLSHRQPAHASAPGAEGYVEASCRAAETVRAALPAWRGQDRQHANERRRGVRKRAVRRDAGGRGVPSSSRERTFFEVVVPDITGTISAFWLQVRPQHADRERIRSTSRSRSTQAGAPLPLANLE